MNYFKSFYEPGIAYSPNWYGTLAYAPSATVLLYNDTEGFCIGFMDSALPDGVTAITEQEALIAVDEAIANDSVWFGERLANRWNEVVTDG